MKFRAWSPAWGIAAFLSSTALFFISTTASSHRSNARKMSQATVLQAVAGPWCTEELPGLQVLLDLFSGERGDAFICSLIGSIVVGLSGIFPLLVIPIEAGAALKTEAGCQKLKQLLSFAVGGLLGDVFLHLLPEAWAYSCSTDGGHQYHKIQGLWVIVGMLSFLVLEKMFPDEGSQEEPSICSCSKANLYAKSSCGQTIGSPEKWAPHTNGHCPDGHSALEPHRTPEKIKTSGYLNLLANCIDNFTHGLAVGGSFLVSKKVGVLTTFAILLHEIPHEVGDFAILLRAGFDRWRAAKMQLSTALGGVLGACFALCAQSPKGTGNSTAWILPFTSGGFLYIALVNIVPDLLEESNPRCSLLQILLLCCGIAVMAVLSAVVD
ncbi:zinc transporter ZIP13 [Brienomyrus brachyistius]|uniref:zinc transporter ZIP13 n=1 Tax=Brienomyrus brachyistius TaxID=42636 RepID=UPI0020B3A27F|nr:zinc transporter ZIP13 [Brienomyrus brachyistius]XP_048887468.1 zinc transporter ZIP13 [Brienomyrus brachyistius]